MHLGLCQLHPTPFPGTTDGRKRAKETLGHWRGEPISLLPIQGTLSMLLVGKQN